MIDIDKSNEKLEIFHKNNHRFPHFWQLPKQEQVKKKFLLAGIEAYYNYEHYLLAKCFLAVSLGICCVCLVYLFMDASVSLILKLAQFGFAAGCGYVLVDLVLYFKIQQRGNTFNKYIVDILDIITISIDAGMTYQQSFQVVVEEFQSINNLISKEFHITCQDFILIPSSREPLLRLSNSIDCPFLQKVLQVLIPSSDIGAPLGQSLSQLSASITQENLALIEKQAHKLPGILTISSIVFLLPILGIIIIGPMYPQLKTLFEK